MKTPFAFDPNVILNSPKKVFAHYFYPFPLSFDNKPAASDYYNTQYLTVAGEANKHAAYGGYLRTRPLGGLPYPATNAQWQLDNMQVEVGNAIDIGISGFAVDLLSYADAISATGHFTALSKAAAAIDARFCVAPMLDMSALTGLTAAQAVQIMQVAAALPNVYRLPDKRLVMMAFNASLQGLAWWQSVITALDNLGIYTAFWPVFLGAPSNAGVLNPIAAGIGGWGTAAPGPAAALQATCIAAHTAGYRYMCPILPQQFRPKDSEFWESAGSAAFRAAWTSAIAGAADAVQVVTWSDFSESGQVQPYTDESLATNIGTGFAALNAYYATWFVTGVQPVITEDVLYWFYRKMPSTAPHPNQPNAFKIAPGETEVSILEVVSFLTLPGGIGINGALAVALSAAAPAGVSVQSIPAPKSGNPVIGLMRNGSPVFVSVCPVTIGPNKAGTLDLTYYSGSISTEGAQ